MRALTVMGGALPNWLYYMGTTKTVLARTLNFLKGVRRKKFFLTMDVEALPHRASHDHVDRLIHGSMYGCKPKGIPAIFDLAEKYNYRVTCFFDYCEYDLYGDKLLDAARYIVSRGHSLQLHAHPTLIARDTLKRLGLDTSQKNLDGYNYHQACILFDYLTDLHNKVTSLPILAFRGGGYQYNYDILNALKKYGIIISSNVNEGKKNQYNILSNNSCFYYLNGVMEVPISVINKDGLRCEYNFNQYKFNEYYDLFTEYFAKTENLHKIANMVLHSRSLLEYDKPTGFFIFRNNKYWYLLNRVLANLAAERFDSIDAEKLAKLAIKGNANVK